MAHFTKLVTYQPKSDDEPVQISQNYHPCLFDKNSPFKDNKGSILRSNKTKKLYVVIKDNITNITILGLEPEDMPITMDYCFIPMLSLLITKNLSEEEIVKVNKVLADLDNINESVK